VFAHSWASGPKVGDGNDAVPDEMAVPYYLSNEGTGPAFDIEHGVEIAGKLHTFEGRQYRTMRAGEQVPQLYDSIGFPVR
jgi:hypothetical protein